MTTLLTSLTVLGALAPAALADTGTISGTVTDAATGQPIQGVSVYPLNPDGSQAPYSGRLTDQNGSYSFSEPAGTYKVEFVVQGGPYQNQFYNGKPSLSSADPVTVTGGQTTPGINAALSKSGAITGTVTAAASGRPVAGAEVAVTLQGSTVPMYATTDQSGSYTVQEPSGTYTVCFSLSNRSYEPQCYNGKASQSSADPVTVTAGQTTSGINAKLTAFGSISGTVTNAATGAPVSGVGVDSVGGTGTPESATTDASGHYTLNYLAAGTYDVRFNDPSGHLATQFYGGALQSSAKGVSVTDGRMTSGINQSLVRGGTLRVTALDARTKRPVGLIGIAADPTGHPNPRGGGQDSGSDGVVTFAGLYPGVPYTISFDDSSMPGHVAKYAASYYCEAKSPSAASSVVVGPGTTTMIRDYLWQNGAAAPACPPPSAAQIGSALTQALAVMGPGARIGAILSRGGYSAPVMVPGAGTERIVWYGKGHRVVVATGTKQLGRASGVTIKVKLTGQGRALLKQARRVKLTAIASFKPKHGKTKSRQKTLTIAR